MTRDTASRIRDVSRVSLPSYGTAKSSDWCAACRITWRTIWHVAFMRHWLRLCFPVLPPVTLRFNVWLQWVAGVGRGEAAGRGARSPSATGRREGNSWLSG